MAWQDQIKDQTKNMQIESRDGFSPEQRFFIGYAQWACENNRPEDQRVSAITNPHSRGSIASTTDGEYGGISEGFPL